MFKNITCFGQNAVFFSVDVVVAMTKILPIGVCVNRVLQYLPLVFAQL